MQIPTLAVADSLSQLMLYSFGAIGALMTLIWLSSLVLKDASLVDRFWGPGFTLIAAVGLLCGAGYEPRRLLLFVMSLWGLRLGWYLTRRNWGHGEDLRYQKMRKHWGPERFWWISFFTVFVLQGAIMFVVGIPLMIGAQGLEPKRLGAFAIAGVVVWLIGLLFESVGDAQLRRFVSDPANKGKVMDRGLWRYTRHPNYFGNALIWWGIWLVVLPVQYGWIAIVGPALMTWSLMYFSGVPILERHLRRTKEGYEEYCQRTSVFFPLPPKK